METGNENNTGGACPIDAYPLDKKQILSHSPSPTQPVSG
jgi:hypothetical protein